MLVVVIRTFGHHLNCTWIDKNLNRQNLKRWDSPLISNSFCGTTLWYKNINRGVRDFLFLLFQNLLAPDLFLPCAFWELGLPLLFLIFMIVSSIAPKRKMALLTIPGSNSIPISFERHTYPEHPVVKDSLLEERIEWPNRGRAGFWVSRFWVYCKWNVVEPSSL